MSVYDKNGNIIGDQINSIAIRDAYINAIADRTINMGSAIGATLMTTLSSEWKTAIDSAYAVLLDAYKRKPNICIPFFLTTDQHGSGLQQYRYVNNIDVDGMNLISINLGDTIVDYYIEAVMDVYYDTIKQVKNYIGVVGNHDATKIDNSELLNELVINRTFSTTNLQRRNAPAKTPTYAVNDTLHGVKWIVLDKYNINAEGTWWNLGYDGATVEWLIDEMSANDGLDIIILEHQPSWRSFTNRENVEKTSRQMGSEWNASTDLLWDFYVNRKNKAQGTYTDMNGIEHSFDFRGCKNDLLCTLSGHLHAEWFTTSYGLSGYTAHRFPYKSVFGMVDRSIQKLRIWEFDTTSASEELQLPI